MSQKVNNTDLPVPLRMYGDVVKVTITVGDYTAKLFVRLDKELDDVGERFRDVIADCCERYNKRG